jgi:hypothetical protein
VHVTSSKHSLPLTFSPPPSHFQLFLLLEFDSLSFLYFTTKTSFYLCLVGIRSVCHTRVARCRYESQPVSLNLDLQNEAHTVSVLSQYSLSFHIINAFNHNGV